MASAEKKQKTNDSLAEQLHEKACIAIDNLAGELHELSKKLWAKPELKFEEHFAHDTVTAFLEKHGFDVRKKYPLETAFVASNKTSQQGNGPCVAILCEYDALPKIGHACGHNLIAEAGAAAAIGMVNLISGNVPVPRVILTLSRKGSGYENDRGTINLGPRAFSGGGDLGLGNAIPGG